MAGLQGPLQCRPTLHVAGEGDPCGWPSPVSPWTKRPGGRRAPGAPTATAYVTARLIDYWGVVSRGGGACGTSARLRCWGRFEAAAMQREGHFQERAVITLQQPRAGSLAVILESVQAPCEASSRVLSATCTKRALQFVASSFYPVSRLRATSTSDREGCSWSVLPRGEVWAICWSTTSDRFPQPIYPGGPSRTRAAVMTCSRATWAKRVSRLRVRK